MTPLANDAETTPSSYLGSGSILYKQIVCEIWFFVIKSFESLLFTFPGARILGTIKSLLGLGGGERVVLGVSSKD